jgi:two-component system sensor histidine kinase UhpB
MSKNYRALTDWGHMSLRLRFLTSVCAALVLSLALGGGITVWQARLSVKTEIDASLLIGRRTVEAALSSAQLTPDSMPELKNLVANFTGDRHIRAELIGPAPAPVLSSTLASTPEHSPDWFLALIGPPTEYARIDLPRPIAGYDAIVLSTDAHNEALEVWNSLRETFIAIVAFSVLSGCFIWFSIGRSLKPLSMMSDALTQIGSGQFGARLAGGGLPETRVISAAFNQMAEELSAVHTRNLELYGQLLTTQEAERTEVARDLHDELGPLLLAINIDTSAIERYAAVDRNEAVVELTRSISLLIRQVQNEVRAIVARLRPIGLAEFGIARAIENLIEFWQRRHPDIRFDLDLLFEAESFGDLLDITAFRIVQEGLSNAVRHGNPGHVTVSVSVETGTRKALVIEVIDDGQGASSVQPGFGLTGMRERVQAAGGVLKVGSAGDQGFAVRASLPLITDTMAGQRTAATMEAL